LPNEANFTYQKLAVQWFNEALCFVSSLAVADSIEFFETAYFLQQQKSYGILKDST
jgi:hypothetical protein